MELNPMTPRITPQITALQFSSQMKRHSAILHRYNQTISSGVRVHRPSDDISIYNMSLFHKLHSKSLSTFIDNINISSNILDNIVIALQDINKLLTKAHHIASTGLDATLDHSTYIALGNEVDMLIHNILSIFNNKIYDNYLFSGDTSNTQPFSIVSYDSSGLVSNIAYVGSVNNSVALVTDTITIPLYFAGGAIEQQGGNSIFQTLIDLRDALLNDSPQRVSALSTAMQDIETARERLSGYIGSISSRLSGLRGLAEQLDAQHYEHEIMQSNLESTDYAEAIVNMNEAQYLLQATMAITARYYSYSFLDYIA
jgi:flagellar hook-associated protein 3 FlgL